MHSKVEIQQILDHWLQRSVKHRGGNVMARAGIAAKKLVIRVY